MPSEWKKPTAVLGIIGVVITVFTLYLNQNSDDNNEKLEQGRLQPELVKSAARLQYESELRGKIEKCEQIIKDNRDHIDELNKGRDWLIEQGYDQRQVDQTKFETSSQLDSFRREQRINKGAIEHNNLRIHLCDSAVKTEDSLRLRYLAELANY